MFLAIKKNLATTLLIIAVVSACQPKKKNRNDNQSSKSSANINLMYENPFADNNNLANFAQNTLSQFNTQFSESSLWALGGCDCSPKFTAQYLVALVKSRGALPQILVPTVREEVRNNSILRTLLSFPPGGLANISNTLLNVFMTDSTVSKMVKSGLNDKFKASLPGGTSIGTAVDYGFDLFQNPIIRAGQHSTQVPSSMDIGLQASKWMLVQGTGALWKNTTPLAFGDHGLQLLATSMTMAEWKYVFGLDESSSNTIYGGLAFNPAQGINAPIGKFDPRVDTGRSGIVSGQYTISFPNGQAIQLATSIKEQWQRSASPVSLDEQARVWASAAQGYLNLRPTARTATTAAMFAGGPAIFPPEAHTLPLAFLKGMAALLDGPIIDKDPKVIHQTADLSPQPNRNRPVASMLSLARMARALNLWIKALESAEQDQLSPEVLQEIVDSRSILKDAMRLAVQSILDLYVNPNVPNRLNTIALVTSQSDMTPPPFAEAAETLAALADIDVYTLKQSGSLTDFSKKVIGLFHWFTSEYMADYSVGSQRYQPSAEGMIWSLNAFQSFSQYPAHLNQAPWLQDILRNLQSAVSNWDGGYHL